MAERRSVIEVDHDDDEARARLFGLATLVFVSTSPRAEHFNDMLRGVRDTARAALSAGVPARYVVAERACWRTIGELTPAMAGKGWFLRPGDDLRQWAERRVQEAVARWRERRAALAEREPSRRPAE